MRRIDSIEEIKQIEIEIFEYIHKICIANGIKYFMACGTLLGAVRHSGFIPWDDDMDVHMYRSDYQRFIKLVNKAGGRYRVITYMNTKDYYYPFARIVDTKTYLNYHSIKNTKDMGIFVDIFPVDYVPEKKSIYQWEIDNVLNVNFLNINLASKSMSKNVYNNLLNKYYCLKISVIIKFMSVLSNKKLSAAVCGVINSSVFATKGAKRLKLLKFEKYKFYAPSNYNEYLTRMYGDYMTPPPKDKQKRDHFYTAYYR